MRGAADVAACPGARRTGWGASLVSGLRFPFAGGIVCFENSPGPAAGIAVPCGALPSGSGFVLSFHVFPRTGGAGAGERETATRGPVLLSGSSSQPPSFGPPSAFSAVEVLGA